MVTEVFILRMEGQGDWGKGGRVAVAAWRHKTLTNSSSQTAARHQCCLFLVLNRCHSLSDPHHSLCKCVKNLSAAVSTTSFCKTPDLQLGPGLVFLVIPGFRINNPQSQLMTCLFFYTFAKMESNCLQVPNYNLESCSLIDFFYQNLLFFIHEHPQNRSSVTVTMVFCKTFLSLFFVASYIYNQNVPAAVIY